MMLGGDKKCGAGQPCLAEAPCGADKPCAAEKPCGGDKPCPAEKTCGGDKPCPAEKPCGGDKPCPAEKPCGADHPCPSETNTNAVESSEKIEKAERRFDIGSRVQDSIGFIQQFALKQELKTEDLLRQ
jgi:hypothetical protein